MGYFPPFAHGLLPDAVLLHIFGVIEIVLALWILSGVKIALPAGAAALMLVFIVAFNLNQFEILFRDLSIAAGSLALALDAWYKKPTLVL